MVSKRNQGNSVLNQVIDPPKKKLERVIGTNAVREADTVKQINQSFEEWHSTNGGKIPVPHQEYTSFFSSDAKDNRLSGN